MTMPLWVTEMMPSDWILFGIAVALLVFVVDYGGFTPWWKSPLGWIVFGYGLSMVMFTGLIIYGVIFGQRVEEWLRIPVMAFVLSMVVGKEIILKVLRREGRIERRERSLRAALDAVSSGHSALPERIPPMSDTKLTVAEIKDATTIWYKAQRVLRTLFTTALTVLPLIPQVIQILQGQWAAEWMTAVGVQALAINAALTAIIALPAVNAWLTKIGLGSVPKSALAVENVVPMTADAEGNYVLPAVDGERVAFVLPDKKDSTRIGAEPSPIAETGDDRG